MLELEAYLPNFEVDLWEFLFRTGWKYKIHGLNYVYYRPGCKTLSRTWKDKTKRGIDCFVGESQVYAFLAMNPLKLTGLKRFDGMDLSMMRFSSKVPLIKLPEVDTPERVKKLKDFIPALVEMSLTCMQQ